MSGFEELERLHRERIIQEMNRADRMTIREAFAMAAMQGLLAYPGSVLSGSYHTNASADDAAKAAVMYADALIEAIKETP